MAEGLEGGRVDETNRSLRRARRLRPASLLLALALALGAALTVGGPARADEYDPEDAGHPLRIIAYVLHPVGVVLDYVVLRPAHWIASHEPMKTLFGHED